MVALPSLRFSPFKSLLLASLVAVTASPFLHAAEDDLFETAAEGATVSFTVSADGNPVPSFQWLKDGVEIPGATSPTLSISSVTTANNGVYNAVATNSAGWALSNDLILNVTPVAVAPSFTLQPYPSAFAPAGSSITLSAAAVGTPAPLYQWLKNGSAIVSATHSTLTLPALTTNDTATYSVIAKNRAGVATSNNSVLTVIEPKVVSGAPVITMQPMSQTVAPTTNVSFKVAVSGTPDPLYQWFKNGTAISGATSAFYIIRDVSLASAGIYTVMAKNSAGVVISQGAALTVK